MKIGILVIGSKSCSSYKDFCDFLTDCIIAWEKQGINKSELFFITEDKRDTATFLYNFVIENLTYQQYDDVIINWNEHGKIAGLKKNQELFKKTSRLTCPKSKSKLVVFLDESDSITELLLNDKWNLNVVLNKAIEEGYELNLIHTYSCQKINKQKEIQEIENPVIQSARLLAEAFKGEVVFNEFDELNNAALFVEKLEDIPF